MDELEKLFKERKSWINYFGKKGNKKSYSIDDSGSFYEIIKRLDLRRKYQEFRDYMELINKEKLYFGRISLIMIKKSRYPGMPRWKKSHIYIQFDKRENPMNLRYSKIIKKRILRIPI